MANTDERQKIYSKDMQKVKLRKGDCGMLFTLLSA